MLKLSVRDLRAHIGRYVLTFIAVAIGVAFVGGVLTLTNTITRTFDDLFADVFEGTDAAVRGEGQFDAPAEIGGQTQRGRIDVSLLDDVLEVDGVAEAEPYIQGYTRVIDAEGEPVGNSNFGPPTFGANWGEVDDLNPFNLVEGEAPDAPDEVVLDKATADSTGYEVGDTARYQSPAGSGEATVVGIARFGTADSPFGASFAMFELETAEELLAEPGQVDGIGIVAEDGISQTEIRDRVAEAVGDDGVEVVTGQTLVDENQDDAAQSFSFVNIALLVFALISVVVGAFVIYTSFSFIIAQRQRQLALLRAVGASRRQVLWSVVLESLVVGIVASVAGYLAGLGLAWGLSQVIVDDAASLAIQPASIVIGLLTGIVITLLSALLPAWRASRVPPVTAMLHAAVDTSHRSLTRLIVGAVVGILGVLLLLAGLRGGEIQVTGLGMLLVFAALVIFGPLAARPAASVLGGLLPPLRGVIGRLAQQNAARNPKRTSSTGSALMIGLGVVTLFLVFNASLRRSIDSFVDDRFIGDFVVDSGTGFSGAGLPGTLTEEVNDLPEVDAAAGFRFGLAEIDGSPQFVSGLDPDTAFDLFDVGVAEGNVSDLDENGMAVFKDTAEDKGWEVGDEVPVVFGETGEQNFTIAALLDTKDVTDDYVFGTVAFDANIPTSGDSQIWIRLADGVSIGEGRAALEGLVGAFPTAEVQDLNEFKEATRAQFDAFLIIVIVLLALTIIVAMIGIVNTMILSVVERTREIGLTRAVGATRAQIRSTIRWEALLIAAFGLLAAIGVGVFFGYVIVNALEEEGFREFAVPIGGPFGLITVTLVTGVLTLLAAVFPAAWAGRRPILSAIATE
ncbi:MAG: ABC transporter permease [Acidimicrobiales bacterium]